MTKNEHLRNGVADIVIRFFERFKPDKIIRCGGQHIIADIGYLAHLAQSHIGTP
jgi:sulfur transfer protein SufE